MKKSVFAIILLFLISGFLISGCATVGGKKTEVVEDTVFYPPLPERPKLQFLMSITSEDDLGRKKNALNNFLLGEQVSNRRIGKPHDIASVKGKIFILDSAIKKLIWVDLSEKKFEIVKDKRMGTLHNPTGIWVTQDETKYVADIKRRDIVVFDRENNFLRSYGNKDIFEKPVDVAVFNNKIYVCDMIKHQVFTLDKITGNLIKTIGKPGKEEGSFWKPTYIGVDHKGFLYVNDAFNFRIQKFDQDGVFVRSFGRLGDNLGCFARPKGIEIDNEGHLYVADTAFENVQIFDDNTGKLLLFFGGSGSAKGSMYLPTGVHIDYANLEYFKNFVDKEFKLKYLLYVGNTFGRYRLNVYGYGDWIGQPVKSENKDKKETAGENITEQ